MSRKDYIAVARIINKAKVIKDGKVTSQLDSQYIVQQIANYFKQDNPMFDYQRFFDACGIAG